MCLSSKGVTRRPGEHLSQVEAKAVKEAVQHQEHEQQNEHAQVVHGDHALVCDVLQRPRGRPDRQPGPRRIRKPGTGQFRDIFLIVHLQEVSGCPMGGGRHHDAGTAIPCQAMLREWKQDAHCQSTQDKT